MMRADYDSEADALDIELVRFKLLEGQDSVDDTYCQVGFAGGVPVCIELLTPAEHLDLLDVTTWTVRDCSRPRRLRLPHQTASSTLRSAPG